VSEHLKQAMCNTDPFGGVAVILSGDPAQLSPVGGKSVWNKDHECLTSDDFRGYAEYKFFDSVVELTENERIDSEDPDVALFVGLLDRIRDGTCTIQDWRLICKKCTLDEIGVFAWKNRGFDDKEVVRLFLTNAEVDVHNAFCLHELNKPILLCEAVNDKGGAKLTPDKFRGMRSSVFLAEGARVMLTQNISALLGLVNGTTGVVKDFVFAEGV
jgi:hypothetical protein